MKDLAGFPRKVRKGGCGNLLVVDFLLEIDPVDLDFGEVASLKVIGNSVSEKR